MISESQFEHDFIEELEMLFPGCVIVKGNSSYIQGFPDRLILYRDKWAALEFKKSKLANRQSNQEYYIKLLNSMSYASFVNPGNREKVIDELQSTFGTSRTSRIFKSK